MNAKYDGYSFEMRDSVARTKVQFHNRYGITLTGDLYLPETYSGKLAAIAVAGPFGAVKEQCAGLYAEELASRGFAAMAFDPSFIGESGGGVRNVASPDINTEDFSAAVDFLSVQDFIDPEKHCSGAPGAVCSIFAFCSNVRAPVALHRSSYHTLTKSKTAISPQSRLKKIAGTWYPISFGLIWTRESRSQW